MSQFGIAVQQHSAPAAPPTKIVQVKAEHEFRFEVEYGNTVKISLVDGTAESFGTELAKDKPYSFSGTNSAIFSWTGCSLKVEGQFHSYVADETPMMVYLNTHTIIQDHRDRARKAGTMGPRVMVVGATDSGKSSLCSLLCNYATRKGETINFIDLDIGQGSITIPSMLAAVSVNKPMDIEEGWASSTPLVQFFGAISPGDNPRLYRSQMQNLAATIFKRIENDSEARAGGYIINTCGWVDGQGYELLLNAIDIFTPDYVLVMSHERLFSDLTQEMRSSGKQAVQIVKMVKSGGVVVRDGQFRRKTRMNKVREYFYGKLSDLSPHTMVLDFKDVSLYRVGTNFQAPATALPIGFEPVSDPLKIQPIQPANDLLNIIVGVSYAASPDKILESNLAGYLFITDVNAEKKKITLLAPCPGHIPGNRIFVIGSLKWLE